MKEEWQYGGQVLPVVAWGVVSEVTAWSRSGKRRRGVMVKIWWTEGSRTGQVRIGQR